MEHFNEESNRRSDPSDPAGLDARAERIAEPKPAKAKPLDRGEEPVGAPADPVEGFRVRESEMPWIADLLERLTPRQQDVLFECCSGGSSPEIARRIGVSESTLQNHLHAMRLKLGLPGRDRISRLVAVRLINGYRTRQAGRS
jgi:DNA-binding CsgD family transcriptional regulator